MFFFFFFYYFIKQIYSVSGRYWTSNYLINIDEKRSFPYLHFFVFVFLNQYKRINSNLLPIKCFPSFVSSAFVWVRKSVVSIPLREFFSWFVYKNDRIPYKLFNLLIRAQWRTKFIFRLLIIYLNTNMYSNYEVGSRLRSI